MRTRSLQNVKNRLRKDASFLHNSLGETQNSVFIWRHRLKGGRCLCDKQNCACRSVIHAKNGLHNMQFEGRARIKMAVFQQRQCDFWSRIMRSKMGGCGMWNPEKWVFLQCGDDFCERDRRKMRSARRFIWKMWYSGRVGLHLGTFRYLLGPT